MTRKLAKLRGLSFRKAPIPALDALEIFVPSKAPPDAELDEVLRQAVHARWYPVPGGEQGLILYRGGPYNSDRFALKKGAWDHAHCALCGLHLALNTLGWISLETSSTIVCDECHGKIFPDGGTAV